MDFCQRSMSKLTQLNVKIKDFFLGTPIGISSRWQLLYKVALPDTGGTNIKRLRTDIKTRTIIDILLPKQVQNEKR